MKTKLFIIIAVMWIAALVPILQAQFKIIVDPAAPESTSVTVNKIFYTNQWTQVYLPLFMIDSVHNAKGNILLERAGVESFVVPRIPGRTVAKEEIIVIAGDSLKYNPLGNYLKRAEGHTDTFNGRVRYVWDTVVVTPGVLTADSLHR
jgi:hypothetical protein